MYQKCGKYDVVVAGGGISGVSCAYTCAKLKLKTLLIEKENYLGGDATGGLVVPVMKTDMQNYNTDFYNDLINYAKKFDAQFTYSDGNKGWFNPQILKCVLENMLIDSGCDILFESHVKKTKTYKNRVKNIIVDSNMLSIPIEAKYYVDATGNADLANLLNCKFWNDTEQKQPDSLRFIMSGVDLDEFADFLNKIDNDKNVTTTYRIDSYVHLSTAYTWDNSKNWALAPYFEKALSDGILEKHDLSYFQIFTVAGMDGAVAFNCPRLEDYDNSCLFEYSNALINARKSILRLANFVKNYFPGFKKAYISEIAPKTGKRETRRVKCKYDYSINDLINAKTFENTAVKSNYPVDIHSNKKNESVLYKVCSYSLPVESLTSIDYENLYIIGKIAGTDFKSQAALRVQASCMSMGEAVGKNILINLKKMLC